MQQTSAPGLSGGSYSDLVTLTYVVGHSKRSLMSKNPEQKVLLRLDGWTLFLAI